MRREFRAATSEPRVALFSTAKDRSAIGRIRRGEQSPNKVLKQISLRPIRLTASGVAFSSAFTRTLFVRLKSSPLLRKLVTDLGRAAKSPAKAPSDPHVSLLYKKLPRATKKELAAVRKFAFCTLVFD